MQKSKDWLYDSKHFRVERVADGVYAVMATELGAAVCNSGIVNLGDCTIVFDSFLTQKAAVDLRAAAEHLTGRKVEYVINSHYHSDHIRGNQVFMDAKIVATTKTRELIEAAGPEDIKWDKENVPKELQAFESERSTQREDEAAMWIAYYRGILESLPTLELRLPNLTFEVSARFHGSRTPAEILTFGKGHSEGDAILHLLDERIAFLGDLLFVKFHPWLGDGDPENWIQILEKVEKLGAEVFVPGHGPVGTTEDLRLMRQYVTVLKQMASEVFTAGDSEEQAAQKAIPSPFETWKFRRFFQANMRFMYKQVSKANTKRQQT